MVKGKNRLVLIILCISNFLCMLDTTIMNIVLSKIQSGLNASLNQVSWTVNLYAIIFSSVTLLAARIAEMNGKGRYLLIGTIIGMEIVEQKNRDKIVSIVGGCKGLQLQLTRPLEE